MYNTEGMIRGRKYSLWDVFERSTSFKWLYKAEQNTIYIAFSLSMPLT